MKQLFDAIRRDASVRNMAEVYKKPARDTLVYGLAGSQKVAVFVSAFVEDTRPLVIVTHSEQAMASWREDIISLLPEVSILEYPELDGLRLQTTARSVERQAVRMHVLSELSKKKHCIVLITATAISQQGLSRVAFARLSLTLHTGEAFGREKLLERLVSLGYESTLEVETKGQFAARGGILDIFPVQSDEPFRVEFFDEEVDSIRIFDPMTKRSLQNVDALTILPLIESNGEEDSEVLLSYLEGAGVVVFDEPLRIREQIQTQVRENPESKKDYFSWECILAAAQGNTIFYTTLLLQKVHGADPEERISVTVQAVAPYNRQMELLREDMAGRLSTKSTVLLCIGDTEKANQLREFFAKSRIPSALLGAEDTLSDTRINIVLGRIENGFELPNAGMVIVAEKDILGRQKKAKVIRAPKEDRIVHFREIQAGDYVVHVNHGIGKYLGVETIDVGGIKKDYLHIKYGGDDKLFVPIDQVGLLQKFIGAEGAVPKLHRMGGTAWAKAKAKARASVEDIADELIELYAKRRQTTGFAFSEDTTWQREFEDAFPYQETDDQIRAIEEIKKDMEKPQPMDRLLCGDVGFGKTEVAIRAAYKAVLDHKQVAVLVPTTVLAQQHFQTFSARFQEFGVNVDVICRFRSAKEQKVTIANTETGRVDILIGTHAVLNQNKVKFQNLGLLIVDEEQRFGVKQKEKIKQLAAGVDVLTLSATPIPRTLHMSLVGARDMSVIETAPEARQPVQTYVMEANDAQIATAIRRELKRGGQIYFIYNRVESIDKMRDHLETLVPEASIMSAHGQMSEDLLERVMMDFYEGHYDILLATSIVENGLDVANANTIFVYDADHFGLSQLYQMRGRVGRSSHMAFAYFLYQRDKVLSEVAEKRLQTMKEFAEIGAGFKIAMRDLEIRGAGNLLGAEQHGHIASVGFEMYTKLLDEVIVEKESGKPKTPELPEPVVDMIVEAYIDGAYISDAMHKIEIYQRMAAIRTSNDIKELLDELIDRFGEPTPPVMRLLEIARIRIYAKKLGIKSVVEKSSCLEVSFALESNVSPEAILRVIHIFGKSAKMLPAPLHMLRVHLVPQYKRHITNFTTRLLLLLLGDEGAFKKKGVSR